MASKPESLKYIGPEPDGVVQLPEGWPAFDHDEPDEAVRAAKLASGKYQAVKPKATVED